MKSFKHTLLFLLLSLGNMVFSQSTEFEYIFDSINNESQFILFDDIEELSNGNYILIGHSFSSHCLYTCLFSSSGEMLAEKNFNAENGYIYGFNNFFIKESKNQDLYLFRSFNPILDTTNSNYMQGIFDAKIVINRLDENFEITYTKEIPVAIDTIDWQTLWNGYHEQPNIKISTVIESENEGFVLSIDKFVAHPHYWNHGNDSTIFYKIDYDGNITKTGFMAHSECNDYRHKNHLLYDKNDNKFYYYMFKDAGFIVCHLDEDFNYLEEYLMNGTTATGSPYMRLRDSWSTVDGITLKRTSDNTTIVGASMALFVGLNSYHGAICMEFDDEVKIIDSIHCGIHAMDHPGIRTSVPSDCSLDWIDEDRIFFGYTPKAYFTHSVALSKRYQYFVLRMLNRNLNTMDEVYYDIKKDSTFLWINTLKATRDGGCMVAGHFWNYIEDPDYTGYDVLHCVVKKFPPEAFLNIEEAHKNGLSVAIAYPNPGSSSLNIRTTLQNAVVEVFDLQGKRLCSQEIGDIVTSIDTDSWESGVYLWNVVKDGKICESGKWVKE